MNDLRSARGRGRALVLAGAGAAGHAWEVGLLAGLAEAGVDLTTADLVIGTSAGATVAAQITTGSDPAELHAAALETPPTNRRAPTQAPARPGVDYLRWSDEIIAAATDPEDMRRRLGAAALERDPEDRSARWRRVVADRLSTHDWPARPLLVPAVDALTGAAVVFDRTSGVDLVDAVAASTSAMSPYRVGGQVGGQVGGTLYLNGGYRRSENADLAAGYARVIVLSPFSGRSRMPAAWGMDLATQIAELRAAGSRVDAVFPDAGSGRFDAGALDPATRPPAARGGHAQGLALADTLGTFWA